MRLLIIDEEAKRRAKDILAYAEQHHYHPGMPTPGNNPGHVGQFNSYRAVFSYTHADGLIWAHLSISVPGSKYPNPFAANEIAELFGMSPKDCAVHLNESEHCVVMGKAIRSTMPKAEAN